MRLLLVVDDYLPHSIKVAAKMMHELALELQNLPPVDQNLRWRAIVSRYPFCPTKTSANCRSSSAGNSRRGFRLNGMERP